MKTLRSFIFGKCSGVPYELRNENTISNVILGTCYGVPYELRNENTVSNGVLATCPCVPFELRNETLHAGEDEMLQLKKVIQIAQKDNKGKRGNTFYNFISYLFLNTFYQFKTPRLIILVHDFSIVYPR